MRKKLFWALFAALFAWFGKDGQAQNPPVSATELRGRTISTTAPTNGQVYVWDVPTLRWKPSTPSAGASPAGSLGAFQTYASATTFNGTLITGLVLGNGAGLPTAAVSADVAGLWPGSGACLLARDSTCVTVSSAFSVLTPAANTTSGTFSFASPAKLQVDALYLGGTATTSPVLDFSGTTARIRRADQAGDQNFSAAQITASNDIYTGSGNNFRWTNRGSMQMPDKWRWQLTDGNVVHNYYQNTSSLSISGFGTNPSITGNASAFTVTVGTGGIAATGTVTNTDADWPGAPQCGANDDTSILLVQATGAAHTTVLTVATVFGAGDKISVQCSFGN